MINKNFAIEISSNLDYEEMIVNILYQEEIVAIVSQEKGIENLEIKLFSLENQTNCYLLEEFLNAIQLAQEMPYIKFIILDEVRNCCNSITIDSGTAFFP